MSACDELSFIAWWQSSSRDSISWSLYSDPKPHDVQINEAFSMAGTSGQKCLNIVLSELSVLKAKKAHVRSASTIVKSVHQWPNTLWFGDYDGQEFGDKFWSPTKWLCHQLLNKPNSQQQWASKIGGKTRRTQEKVRNWETVRRYVLENVTINQSGGSIGQKMSDARPWKWLKPIE